MYVMVEDEVDDADDDWSVSSRRQQPPFCRRMGLGNRRVMPLLPPMKMSSLARAGVSRVPLWAGSSWLRRMQFV